MGRATPIRPVRVAFAGTFAARLETPVRDYLTIPCDVVTRDEMTALKPHPDGTVDLGTLGFFVTFAGVDPPHNIALVTNNHVFTESGGREGDSVYQPAWATQPDGTPGVVKGGEDLVGTVIKLPNRGNDTGGSFVDAALNAWNKMTPEEQSNFQKIYREATKGIESSKKAALDNFLGMRFRQLADFNERTHAKTQSAM